MTNYREILRLSSLQYSQRTIESMAHCSRHTVRDVLQAAKEQGISWPLSDDVANADLEQLLFPNRHKASSQYAEPDYPYIHRELARSGVTLTLLWEEYCAKCQEAGKRPYMSTQFGERYRRWARITKATMRIQHKPGDAMQVDWAGDTIPIQDPVTGEQSAAYLFVAVLPCSYYTYAEACDDMKTENWLNCHVHAFDFFGGVARLLIPDNCKTATLSNTRYDVILNRSYQELAEHYGTAIVPARVRKPKDKSPAEAPVRFAETWIVAALRDRKFFSLRELNEAVAEKLDELNSRPFKQMAGCRRSAYLEEEKPYMLPLPVSAFEPAVWSVAKVANDYLVTDGRNKYSVPYRYNKQKNILDSNLPAVVYSGSHLAVIGSKTVLGQYILLDPIKGKSIVNFEQIHDTFSDILITIRPEKRIKRKKCKPKLKVAINYKLVAGIISLMLLIQALTLSIPLVEQALIDSITQSQSLLNSAYILVGCIVIAGLYFFLSIARQKLMLRLDISFVKEIMTKMLKKLFDIDPSFFEWHAVGEIVNRFSNVQAINNIIINTFSQVAVQIITSTICLVKSNF